MYTCTRIWRWFYAVCNILILFYFAVSYEDYDSKIYRTLVELQSDIKVLKGFYHATPAVDDKGLWQSPHNYYICITSNITSCKLNKE